MDSTLLKTLIEANLLAAGETMSSKEAFNLTLSTLDSGKNWLDVLIDCISKAVVLHIQTTAVVTCPAGPGHIT
jgi:hypothetical protein